jgi:hypothetical protein
MAGTTTRVRKLEGISLTTLKFFTTGNGAIPPSAISLK